MDSFEFNKIAMAVLAVIFAVMGVGILSEAIFHAEAPEEPAFVIAEGGPADVASDDSGPAFEPVTPLLASADVSAGETVFKKCAACHTVDNGGANKVGPNLWDIVNRPIASHEGFSYSAALKEFGEGKQWTYEELNGFIWKPKTYVRGTAMGFVGLPKVEDRANVIAYLRTMSDSPAPLPEPMVPTAETEEDGPPTASDGTSAPESGEQEDAQPQSGSDDATGESGESGGDGEESQQ